MSLGLITKGMLCDEGGKNYYYYVDELELKMKDYVINVEVVLRPV